MAELTALQSSGSASALTVSSETLNPTSLTGGSSSQGIVTLSGAAPSGGAVVTLSSNNTVAAIVPATVSVAAGATSASFTISTSVMWSFDAPVTISANYGGGSVGGHADA